MRLSPRALAHLEALDAAEKTDTPDINELLLSNEQLASDVRALTYTVADLTETVEILTRIIVEK